MQNVTYLIGVLEMEFHMFAQRKWEEEMQFFFVQWENSVVNIHPSSNKIQCTYQQSVGYTQNILL